MTTYSSNFVENSVINYFLRGMTIYSPCPVYVALYTAAPSDTGGGTEVTNVGTTYKRISASGVDRYNSITQEPIGPPDPTTWWTVTNGVATNNNEIIFPTCGATTWGTITHMALVSGNSISTSGSTFYFYAPLVDAMNITNNDYVSFPAGSLELTLSGAYTRYTSNMVLNYYLNRTPMTSPEGNVRAGLFLVMPDEDTGEGGTEVPIYYQGDGSKYTGYGRKYCFGTSFWSTPTDSSGSTSNRNDFVFTVGASYDWGNVSGVVIYDNNRNQMLIKSPFYSTIAGVKTQITKQVLASDSFKFGQGYFKVSFD